MTIDPVSGLGMILGLLAWLRSETGGRNILKDLNSQGTTSKYLEWLRRKDQSELISEINSFKADSLSQLAEIGPQLSVLAEQIYSVAGDLTERLDDLNSKISPPALYSIPLETRASAPVSIRCREKEIEFLSATKSDAIVVGQPGTGKTFLLTEFARKTNAKFLLTSDSDVAVAAVTTTCPEIVIVDDAWARMEIVKRLSHARKLHRFRFRIVAICWPFEKDDIQLALRIHPDNVLELEGLPRKEIAAIVKEVVAIRKMVPNDAFIRIVVQQARGRPGLAVSLTLATMESSGEELLSGNILLRDLGSFMQRYVSSDARVLLAAFACGGSRGIGVAEVARVLNKDIGLTKAAADKIALVGTLEQTGKETLAVQPEFLRAALIKQVFFPEKGGGLSWGVCESLISLSPDTVSGYETLFRARSLSDAQVDDILLRDATARLDDSRLWGALAWLDADNCDWVLQHQVDYSANTKRAALHYIPEKILPRMLANAAVDNRSLNAFPEADMRLVFEWIQQGWSEEGVRRRCVLFNVVVPWINSGADILTGFEAIRAVFDLKFETTESDPADSQTINIRSGAISLDSSKKVFELWPQFLLLVRSQEKCPWPKVIRTVSQWSGQHIGMGYTLSSDYSDFLSSCFKQMILELLPLAGGNQAVNRWLFLKAKKRGIELGKCPVSEDFMVLYPEENFGDDYKKWEAEQSEVVQALVDRWNGRAIKEIIQTFITWQRQVEESCAIYSAMPAVFCSKLAGSRKVSTEDLGFILEKLPSQYVGPFIVNAVEAGKLSGELINTCLSRGELAVHLIEPVLTDKMPELYEPICEHLPQYRMFIAGLCAKGQIPNKFLECLLRHKNSQLRFSIASEMLQPEGGITYPVSLQNLWRAAIVESLSEILASDDPDGGLYLHKLELVLKKDSSIAFEVWQLVLPQKTFLLMRSDGHLHQLADCLTRDQRQILLPLCKSLVHSDLPAILVGGDLDLYNYLLSNEELKHYHLNLLAGDPTGTTWAVFAKAALKKGYKHAEVMYATQGDGYSWSGNMSEYYQQWVNRFEKLKNYEDSDMQQIGGEGLKWAISNRDACRRSERKEQILG